jgi:hypothetical protein
MLGNYLDFSKVRIAELLLPECQKMAIEVVEIPAPVRED